MQSLVGAMASTNKSLAQMNNSPKVAAGVAQKIHSGRGTSVRASKEVFGPEYRDIRPALLTGPSQHWLGPFSIHGSDEQIFGANEQIVGRDQSD